MLCINCDEEMERYHNYYRVLEDNKNYHYTIEDYKCPKCGIKIRFSSNIFNYGIIKTEVPDNLKPTLKQSNAMDAINHYIPETIDERKLVVTKNLASFFISKYKEQSESIRDEYVESMDYWEEDYVDDDLIF